MSTIRHTLLLLLLPHLRVLLDGGRACCWTVWRAACPLSLALSLASLLSLSLPATATPSTTPPTPWYSHYPLSPLPLPSLHSPTPTTLSAPECSSTLPTASRGEEAAVPLRTDPAITTSRTQQQTTPAPTPLTPNDPPATPYTVCRAGLPLDATPIFALSLSLSLPTRLLVPRPQASHPRHLPCPQLPATAPQLATAPLARRQPSTPAAPTVQQCKGSGNAPFVLSQRRCDACAPPPRSPRGSTTRPSRSPARACAAAHPAVQRRTVFCTPRLCARAGVRARCCRRCVAAGACS